MQRSKAIPCLPPGDDGNLRITLEIQKDSPFISTEFSTVPATQKPAPVMAA
jgi:hypothetical protein